MRPRGTRARAGDARTLATVVLLGTFFALCLAIWGFALSRNETTPRRAIYAVLLVLLFAMLVAWSLTIVGVVASAWAVAEGMSWLDALKGGFAAATLAALALLGACVVSFVLLAKWTWELNRRLDRVLPPWQGNGP